MTLLLMYSGGDTMTSSIPKAWMEYYQRIDNARLDEDIILLMAGWM